MVNIPNALSAFRLVGSFVLMGIAVEEWRVAFVWLLMALLVSDWIDGKLAIALRQQTIFGARLDSAADASMYGAMLFGFVRLHADLVYEQWPWLAAAVASYLLTTTAGLIKYGKIPAYHTRLAKIGWLLVSLAALAVFAFLILWPLQLVAAWVIMTNLEATAMTWVLSRWHSDIPSLWQARRLEAVAAKTDGEEREGFNGGARVEEGE